MRWDPRAGVTNADVTNEALQRKSLRLFQTPTLHTFSAARAERDDRCRSGCNSTIGRLEVLLRYVLPLARAHHFKKRQPLTPTDTHGMQLLREDILFTGN